MSSGGRGQLLMPWPNRIRDGRYSFGGRDLQLGADRAARAQRLARPGPLGGVDARGAHGQLGVAGYRLMAQTGYPWTLDLHVLYDLSADGLTVTQTATNLGGRAGAVRQRRASLPQRRATARRRPGADPAGRHPRASPTSGCCRPVRGRVGDAVRLPGRAAGPRHRARPRVRPTSPRRRRRRRGGLVRDPATGHGVALWVDRHHRG